MSYIRNLTEYRHASDPAGPSVYQEEREQSSSKFTPNAPSFHPNQVALSAPYEYMSLSNFEPIMASSNPYAKSQGFMESMRMLNLTTQFGQKAKYVLDPQALTQVTSKEYFDRYSPATFRQSTDYLKAIIDARNETPGDYVFLVAFDLRMIPIVNKQILPLTLSVLYDYFILQKNIKPTDFVDTMEILNNGQYVPITHCQIYVRHSNGTLVPTGVYRRPDPQDESLHQVLHCDGWTEVRQSSIDCLIQMGKMKAKDKESVDAEKLTIQAEINQFGRT